MLEIDKIPKTLEEAFEHLERDADPKDLKKWAAMDERTAMANVHHGLGRAMRNDWGLWYPESPLHQYFNRFGIKHGDDLSGVLFTSFHRKLNNKDIDLEEQLKVYWAHWTFKYPESELMPSNIDGVEEKYLELYNEFVKDRK